MFLSRTTVLRSSSSHQFNSHIQYFSWQKFPYMALKWLACNSSYCSPASTPCCPLLAVEARPSLLWADLLIQWTMASSNTGIVQCLRQIHKMEGIKGFLGSKITKKSLVLLWAEWSHMTLFGNHWIKWLAVNFQRFISVPTQTACTLRSIQTSLSKIV